MTELARPVSVAFGPRPHSPLMIPSRPCSAPPVNHHHRGASPGRAPSHRVPSPMSASIAVLGLSPGSASATAAALRALSLSPRAAPPVSSYSWTSRFPGAPRHASPVQGRRSASPCKFAGFSAGSPTSLAEYMGHPAHHGQHRRSRSESADLKLAAQLADRLVNNAASAMAAAAAAAVTAVAVAAANAQDDAAHLPMQDSDELVFDLDLDGASPTTAAAAVAVAAAAVAAVTQSEGSNGVVPLSAPIPQRTVRPTSLPPRSESPAQVESDVPTGSACAASVDTTAAAGSTAVHIFNKLVTPSKTVSPLSTKRPAQSQLPPAPRRTVSFPSHIGSVRFFRRNDRPVEVSSARWAAADEPEAPSYEWCFLAPNWPLAPGGVIGARGATVPVTSPMFPTSPSKSQSPVPALAYHPTAAPPTRTPAHWDTVLVESVQLSVGVCPQPIPVRAKVYGRPALPTPPPASSERAAIVGTVVVRNLSYDKRVTIRCTHDFWRSWRDVECTYVGEAETPGFERWRFELEVTNQLATTSAQPGGHSHASIYFCAHLESFVQEVVPTSWSSGCGPSSPYHLDQRDSGSRVVSRWESAWDNNGGTNYELVIKRRQCPRIQELFADEGLDSSCVDGSDEVADHNEESYRKLQQSSPSSPSALAHRERVLGAQAE